jgi:hypothetical protein
MEVDDEEGQRLRTTVNAAAPATVHVSAAAAQIAAEVAAAVQAAAAQGTQAAAAKGKNKNKSVVSKRALGEISEVEDVHINTE